MKIFPTKIQKTTYKTASGTLNKQQYEKFTLFS